MFSRLIEILLQHGGRGIKGNSICLMGALLTVFICMMICTVDTEAHDEEYVGESIEIVEEGFLCVLKDDGTAIVAGIGEYEATDHFVEIPAYVTSKYGNNKYLVTELGPRAFQGSNTRELPFNSRSVYYLGVSVPYSVEIIDSYCFFQNWGKLGKTPIDFKFETRTSEDRSYQLNLTLNDSEELPRLKELGDHAFSSVNISSVTLPPSVTVLGDYCFEKCKYLKTINLDKVVFIGNYAFKDASKIENLSLDSSNVLEYVGCKAFTFKKELEINLENCVRFYPDSFPTNVNLTLGPDAPVFDVKNNSGKYKLYRSDDGTVTILSIDLSESSNKSHICIPKDVTALTQIVLAGIVSISFEEGSLVQKIDDDALKSMNELSVADFSNATRLTEIGANAFSGCNLKVVDLSKTKIETIGSSAFSNCPVESLLLPSTTRVISQLAFKGNNLATIDLSNATMLSTIGNEAFQSAFVNLTSICMKGLSNLEAIDPFAFKTCASGTVTVDLSGCSSLKTVSLDAFALESKATGSFILKINGCASLQSFTLKKGIVIYDESTVGIVSAGTGSVGVAGTADSRSLEINEETFALNSDALSGPISKIVISKSSRFVYNEGLLLSSDGKILYKAIDSITSVKLPASVEHVYKDALRGCNNLSSVTVGQYVDTSDWLMAFEGQSDAVFTVSNECDPVIVALNAANISFNLLFVENYKDVVIASELGFKYATPTVTFLNGFAEISMSYSGGYSDYDIYITDGTDSFSHGKWIFKVENSIRLVIKALERTGQDAVTISFNPSGGNFDNVEFGVRTIELPRGLTLIDSDIVEPVRDLYTFKGWKLTNAEAFYDFDEPLVNSIELIAVWEYRGATVTFDSQFGEIYAVHDGKIFSSGDLLKEGSIRLSFYPYPGYSFSSWVFNESTSEDTNLILQNITSDTTVSVEVRSYSADSLKSLVMDNNAPIDPSKYSLSWSFGGKVDTSMTNWTGHPSNPIISGDHVYVRIGGLIYQLSLNTGLITGSVPSINQTDFYHQIGYCNGMLIDYANGKVYDDDLNLLFVLTGGKISYATYSDGLIVCMLDGSPAAFDAIDRPGEIENKVPKWKSSESGWFSMYGIVSTPVIYGGYMYYIDVQGIDISIKSINLIDGSTKDSTGSLERLRGQYLDNGWLSMYDGTLYLTSYAYGLFGTTSAQNKVSMITSINTRAGEFIEDSIDYTELVGYDSLTSQFVVFNGRGYVYTYSYTKNESAILVFNVEDMVKIGEKTYKGTAAQLTHGSIVVDGSLFKSTNTVQIYFLDYNNAKMHVYSDNHSMESGSISYVGTYFGGTYCSQAVRFGQNGEMLWYDDSGYLQCYSSSIDRYLFISEGDNAKWHLSSGKTVFDSFKSLGSDVLTIDDKTKTITSVNGKTGDWSLYCLQFSSSTKTYSWVKIDDLADAVLDKQHYFAIVSGEPPLEVTYTYLADNSLKVYKFSTSGIPSDIIGKEMKASTDVISISFTDPKGILVDSAYLVVRDQEFVVEYPVASRAGFSAKWLDASGNPAPRTAVSFSSNQVFTLQWIEISYDIKIEGTESFNTMNYIATVTRMTGTDDLDNLKLFVVVKYEDSRFLNLYSEITKTDGSSKIRFGAGSEGLEAVYLYVVSGEIGQTFDRYGETSLSYAK